MHESNTQKSRRTVISIMYEQNRYVYWNGTDSQKIDKKLNDLGIISETIISIVANYFAYVEMDNIKTQNLLSEAMYENIMKYALLQLCQR